MARLWPHRAQVPIPAVVWRFAAYWRLPAALTRAWWQALSHSRYSQPQALRQAWLLFEGAPIADPASVVHQTCAARCSWRWPF